MKIYQKLLILTFLLTIQVAQAQKTIISRFKETDEVLTNPGIGFMTFLRFNGEARVEKGNLLMVCIDFEKDIVNRHTAQQLL